MARVASTDLLCMFTIGASSYPTTTQVTALIVKIYKQVYRIVYGTGHYSADESTDTESIIDTDEMKEVIGEIAEEMSDAWFLCGVDNPKPSFRLTKKDEDAVQEVAAQKRKESDPMDNIRLWGSDFSDWSGMY